MAYLLVTNSVFDYLRIPQFLILFCGNFFLNVKFTVDNLLVCFVVFLLVFNYSANYEFLGSTPHDHNVLLF